jgi:hypothetical protein
MEESSEISPDTYVSIQRMIDQSNKRMEDYRNSPEGIRDREYSDRMADARQQRRVLISDIVSRGGCLEENIVVEDILDHERQIMFEHHFPNYPFDPEKYQYALDYDGAAYFPHPFTGDREVALRFKSEARRFEIQNGEGRYTIAGMPSDQYRVMQRRDAGSFRSLGMVGYCTPHRDMLTANESWTRDMYGRPVRE